MASSTTTGSFTTLPTPRIATCGWLMTGVAKMLPKLPKLVIENVPPCTSSGLQLARAGARGQVGTMEPLQAHHVLLVGVADHRDDQAVLERHGHAEIDVAVVDDVGSVDRRVDDRELPQRRRGRAHHERQERQAEVPYCAWNWPLSLSRSLATLVMSTLCTVVTCAEVRLLNTMCSAIFWRITLMGSTR
jgi:hypothetical protein